MSLFPNTNAGTAKEIVANTAGLILKTGPGVLRRIVITLPGGATIRLYDGIDNSGVPIVGGGAATALPAAGTTLTFECNFYTGLFIIVAGVGTTSFTVVFN